MEYKAPEELIDMDQEDLNNAAHDFLNNPDINPEDIDIGDIDKDEVMEMLEEALINMFDHLDDYSNDWDDWYKDDEDNWDGNKEKDEDWDDKDIDWDDVKIDDIIECGEPDSEVALMHGTYPKQCEGDNDCLLVNGEYGKCSCSVDGLSYCLPHFYDEDVLPEFWESCSDGEATIGMKMQREWFIANFNDFGKLACYDKFPDELLSRQVKDDIVDSASSSSSSYAATFGVVLVLLLG